MGSDISFPQIPLNIRNILSQSLEQMAENEMRFFEVEMVREGKAATRLTTSVQQHHPPQDPKGPFLPKIKCVPKLCPVETVTLLLTYVA